MQIAFKKELIKGTAKCRSSIPVLAFTLLSIGFSENCLIDFEVNDKSLHSKSDAEESLLKRLSRNLNNKKRRDILIHVYNYIVR